MVMRGTAEINDLDESLALKTVLEKQVVPTLRGIEITQSVAGQLKELGPQKPMSSKRQARREAVIQTVRENLHLWFRTYTPQPPPDNRRGHWLAFADRHHEITGALWVEAGKERPCDVHVKMLLEQYDPETQIILVCDTTGLRTDIFGVLPRIEPRPGQVFETSINSKTDADEDEE
jgi:hypothetical protein